MLSHDTHSAMPQNGQARFHQAMAILDGIRLGDLLMVSGAHGI